MGWLWVGLLLGLLVGAGVVAALLRAVGRITGTGAGRVVGLVVDGLTPGRRTDGVAAQRALARRLKKAGDRTASGRRVAAEQVTVQVSPEDEEAIVGALGLEAAERDLEEFYRAHASRNGWIVGAAPQVRIVRDISLRPRQAVVRTVVAPGPPQPAPARDREPPEAGPEPLPVREAREMREHHPAPKAPFFAPRDDDAVTDVLPRGLLEDAGPFATAVYPVGAPAGDLTVVHGTDVRTVPASRGSLRIGRGAHNDLVLARPGVGRDHVVIEVRGGSWWVVPGTAQGGTALDGVEIDGPTELAGTSTLALGRGVRVRVGVDGA